MSGQKRSFPYASAVPEFDFKRRDLGTRHAGRETALPKIHESSLPMHYEQQVRLHTQEDCAD